MSLLEAKIKEAILDPDVDIRDRATRYFANSSTPDPTIMPLAIQAIERYGRTKAFSFTHELNILPQTEQTIAWVIVELQRDFDGRPDERYFYYLNLSRLLCHADIRLVAQHAPDILQARHFDPKEKTAFRERLEMFGWNAEKCWRELQQYCEANKENNNLEDFNLGHALRIVEALARQPHEYQEQIVAILSEQVHDFRHDARKWLQPLMANLAGDMRLQAAIPPLVSNLGHPYSFLSDQCMFALAKIGNDHVVATVCDQFPRASKDFRLWASDLLCKIHRDTTVQRVVELLSGETDLAIRLNLCEALLDQFSVEGVEPARQLIKQHGLTPDLRTLRSSLIAVCKIIGSGFPEFDLWHEEAKRDAQEEWAKTQEIQKLAFEAGGDMGLLVRKLKAQIAEQQLERKELEAEVAELRLKRTKLEAKVAEKERLLERMPSPGRTKPSKTGRNDPCPCGSGKKFKNCCIKKQVGLEG